MNGGIQKLGYYRLRKSLQCKGYSMSDLAECLQITYTEAYSLTSVQGDTCLSEEQKDLIMEKFFKDSKQNKKEVFENSAYSANKTKRFISDFDSRER